MTLAKARLEDREAERAAALARWQAPQPEAPPPDLTAAEERYREALGELRVAEDTYAKAKRVLLRRALVALALVIGELVIIWPALDGLNGVGDWLLVIVTAVLTIAASIVVLFRTSFGWFALASFVAVAIFVAVASYERTKNDTKVFPAALVHDGNVPAWGFFVTETSDRVYIAQPQRKLRSQSLRLSDTGNRMLELDRTKVTNLQIGPLIRTERAYRRSLELAAVICTVPRRPTPKTKKPTPPCDPARFAALTAELNRVRKLG